MPHDWRYSTWVKFHSSLLLQNVKMIFKIFFFFFKLKYLTPAPLRHVDQMLVVREQILKISFGTNQTDIDNLA